MNRYVEWVWTGFEVTSLRGGQIGADVAWGKCVRSSITRGGLKHTTFTFTGAMVMLSTDQADVEIITRFAFKTTIEVLTYMW